MNLLPFFFVSALLVTETAAPYEQFETAEVADSITDGAQTKSATFAASDILDEASAEAPPAETASLSRFDKTRAFVQKGFKFVSPDGNYALRVGLRTHLRYTFNALDSWGEEKAYVYKNNFSIPAAKITLSGHLFGQVLYYAIEGDFGGGKPSLQDCFINLVFIPKKLHLKIGQWKSPIFRQSINSSGRLELTETTFFLKHLGSFTDLGLALHNGYTKSPRFEWVIAVLNGSNMANLDELHPRVTGRIGYNSAGLDSYSESDFQGGPARFGIAGNLLLDFDVKRGENSSITASIDFILKAYGFSMNGALFIKTRQVVKNNGETSFINQAYSESSFYLQCSYLIRGIVAPVARFALISPNQDRPAIHESALGINWYVIGHNFKWQLMGAMRVNDYLFQPARDELLRRDSRDLRLITQLVLAI